MSVSERGPVPEPKVNLYDHVYGDFDSTAEGAVRRETYGEDLGQSSWLTATEWLGFADQLGIGRARTSSRWAAAPGGLPSIWPPNARAA